MAPLLSIVVPVHSVQGYLRECLDSLLNQSFTDLEVVAVDDRSPDHCPEILDEYAARDRRVRVLHLDPNVGLGPARNVGLDHARGEYVWFVDSDDWIAPGSLHAIATKLRQTRPEILLVDHTRVSWLGKHGRSEGRHLLADLDQPVCFSLADQPEVLTLFTVAWNKVVRRDFLIGTGLRFDVGWYEDLPFTFPILVAADRIAALGRVCYHYRKRRQEAITQTTSERHFEVFDQWTRVFDRLDALGPRAEPFRGPVFERMLWHLLVVQSRPDRLPAGTRRAYFSRLSEYYRRYAPTADGVRTRYGDATVAGDPTVAGEPTVAGDSTADGGSTAEGDPVRLVGLATPSISRLNRLRRSLIAKDRYRTFRGLRLARLTLGRVRRRYRRTRRLARSAARTMMTAFRTATGRAWYALQRRLPIDDRQALYAAYWYRGVSCNPAAIDAAARRLVPQVRSVWVLDADRVEDAPLGTTYVIPGTLAYYRALARSRWLVNNVNFPDFVAKRPGTVHLQTHHGTPVKVMGLDQGKYPVGAQGLDLSQLMRRCDRWDFSLSSNAHSTEAWSRSYPCRYTTLEYGYPRNDRLALATAADVAKARALLGIDDERRVVLYAPTHREYQPGFQPFLALDEFADALGSDTLVLQRAHYFYANTPPVAHSCVWDVSDYPVVEDLLLAADVLVTDYSSIQFDYAVLDRPIAVFAPDWEAYTRTRGVTFDLLAEPPGVVATSQAQLQAAFASGAVDSEAAGKLRATFRAKFCYLDDGYAAERVVRRVFCDELP